MIHVNDDPRRWTRAGCLFVTLWTRYRHPHTLAHADAHAVKRALLHRDVARDMLDILPTVRYWRSLSGVVLARLRDPIHRSGLAWWTDRVASEATAVHGALEGERRGLCFLLDAIRAERGYPLLAESVWRSKVS